MIKIHGLDNVVRNIRLYGEQSVEDVQRIVQQGAGRLRDHAKNVVPVRTARLKNSIQVTSFKRTSTGAEATVGPNTEYEMYVEYGTSRMAARPYMRPATEQAFQDMLGMVKRSLR